MSKSKLLGWGPGYLGESRRRARPVGATVTRAENRKRRTERKAVEERQHQPTLLGRLLHKAAGWLR